MKQVSVVDARPKWEKREEALMQCLESGCRNVSFCLSLMGRQCKHLGGDKIPKVRARR